MFLQDWPGSPGPHSSFFHRPRSCSAGPPRSPGPPAGSASLAGPVPLSIVQPNLAPQAHLVLQAYLIVRAPRGQLTFQLPLQAQSSLRRPSLVSRLLMPTARVSLMLPSWQTTQGCECMRVWVQVCACVCVKPHTCAHMHKH